MHYLPLIIAGLVWLAIWVPIMVVVASTLLWLSGRKRRLARQPMRLRAWLGLALTAAGGAWLSFTLFQASIPTAMPAAGTSIFDLQAILLLLLWLLVHVACGGILAGIARAWLLTRDWVTCLAAIGILGLPLLGLLAGAWSYRAGAAEAWRALGTPPAPAARVASADMAWLVVEARDGTTYGCCTGGGQWRQGYRPPALRIVLTPPAMEGDRWTCANCLYPEGLSSGRPMAIPAPPVPLAQPTLFSISTSRPDYHTFGGAGIAADGQVWEWRRYKAYYPSQPLDGWYLTPLQAHQAV